MSTIQTVAYLLLIDGCPIAFATNEDVDLAYVQTLGEFTGVHYGLDFAQGLGATLDLASGLLQDSSATIDIVDVDSDGMLADLFASSLEDATELLTEILPGDTAPVAVWGKHVGTEMIGPAGERRQCSCVPGWAVGMHHFSSAQTYAMGSGETPVSDSPVLWAGRRACLYRLVRTANVWPDITVAEARRDALVWFGTFLGQGKPAKRKWSLRFAGPESWAMGSLATGLSTTALPVRAAFRIGPEDSPCSVSIQLKHVFLPTSSATVTYGIAGGPDVFSGLTSVEDVIDKLNEVITDAITQTGYVGTSFQDAGLSDAYFSTTPGSEGIMLLWDSEHDPEYFGGNYTAQLKVVASGTIMKMLGFDPEQQRFLAVDDELYVDFTPAQPDTFDMWSARFTTVLREYMPDLYTEDADNLQPLTLSNNANYRRWGTVYPGGAQVFNMNAPLQEITFDTNNLLYLMPSSSTPLPGANGSVYAIGEGVGAVTHTGLLAVRGPYRKVGQTDDDATTTTQVARVAWRASPDGSVALDNSNRPRLVIMRWEPPRRYNIDNDQVSGSWATFVNAPEGFTRTEARQIVALEHNIEGSDSLPYVLARLLTSTGGAGDWYTDDTLSDQAYWPSDVDPVLDVGPNDLSLVPVGDELLGQFTDADAPGLGRGIPASMIASHVATSGSLLNAMDAYAADDLMRCKVTFTETQSLRKLLDGMLRVTGLAMSLADGRFGLFDPWSWRTNETTGIVDVESYASEPGEPAEAIPEQELRELAAIDVLEVKAVRDATANKYAREVERRATDSGSQYRAQTVRRSIDAPYLLHPRVGGLGSGWATALAVRWDTGFRWWAQSHFKVKFSAPLNRHREFWPGAVISLTDEWIVNPVGGYGVAASPGFVLSRRVNTEREIIEVEALVNGEMLRVYSPAFVVTEYDDANATLAGYADWLGCRGDATTDADGFIEPSWSNEGGDALIIIRGFDATGWTGTHLGQVVGLDLTDPTKPVLQLAGALTGSTWRRDHHHVAVLRLFSDQTAPWVARAYAPVCDKDGTADGAVLGTKFVG